MNLGNPIKKINNVDVSWCPSANIETHNDVSSANSGRNEAGTMIKSMLGTAPKCEMTFQNISAEKASEIMKAVKVGEYIDVTYIDLEDGTLANNFVVTRNFYVGDRNVEWVSTGLGIVTLSLSIIARYLY